jgi:hypothetical protein
LEQAGGSLDISEQEGNRAARTLRHRGKAYGPAPVHDQASQVSVVGPIVNEGPESRAPPTTVAHLRPKAPTGGVALGGAIPSGSPWHGDPVPSPAPQRGQHSVAGINYRCVVGQISRGQLP